MTGRTKRVARSLPDPQEDGLAIPEVGRWSDLKYRHLANYAAIFGTSMKRKWGRRVYLDLFAGAGYARIEGAGQIVRGSPLCAIGIPDPCDLYVFCEQDERKLEALEKRVRGEAPAIRANFQHGDVNETVGEVLKKIPLGRKGATVLTFCFADIYALENLAFETVRSLATRFMDFLILIPTGMDAVRNFERYAATSSKTVERFLGRPEWRDEWHTARTNGQTVSAFLLDSYGRSMAALEYKYSGPEDTRQIRSTSNNLPLYHLAFFSRHQLGRDFWNSARKYADPQLGLGL